MPLTFRVEKVHLRYGHFRSAVSRAVVGFKERVRCFHEAFEAFPRAVGNTVLCHPTNEFPVQPMLTIASHLFLMNQRMMNNANPTMHTQTTKGSMVKL